MNRTAPSTLIAALALLVLLGVALAAGCTTPSSGSKDTVTPTPADTTAAGRVTTAGTSGSGSGSAAVAAVGYGRLIPFVPKAAGAWKLDGDPMGMTSRDSDAKEYSWVTGTYNREGNEDVQANVQIHDLATAESPLKGMWKGFTAYESTEGYMKSTTIKGFPAWDVHNKDSKDYSMMIGVGDRYMVYVTVEDATRADLDTLVNAIDLAGLAAVK